MSEGVNRALPSAIDAEDAALGCLMLSPVEVYALMTQHGIGPAHFASPPNREILSTIEWLIRDGAPVEALMIATRLRDAGKLESVGGFARISALNTGVGTAVNAAHYLRILHEKHLLRRAILVGTGYAREAYEPDADPLNILQRMHAEITALLSKQSTRPRLLEVMKEIIREVQTGQDDLELLPVTLDGIKGRLKLYRGDLLIVSAPTSCGKSALSAQLAFDQAVQGRRVALYPLEMAQKQTLKRAIAQLGGNNADWVRSVVQKAGIDVERIEKAKPIVENFVATANTILRFDPHLRDDLFSLEAIAADIRAEHSRKPFAFVLIDYLQLLTCAGRFERKQLQIAHITQSLKRLASELGCVVCLPSQVNNDGATREAKDAENDASALVKICGEEDDKGDVRPGRVTIWKQREGARHIDLPLKFNGLLTRFEANTQ